MKLTIYDFSKIMTDLPSLQISNFHIDKCWTCPDNGECYRFDWEWHGYSGSGSIYLINGVVDINSVFCRDSYLAISSNSLRQAENKHVSEVYNEPKLVNLMQYIADSNKKSEEIL